MAFNVACRFRDDYSLSVRPHGHGLKLSIEYDDSKLGTRRVSVFLDSVAMANLRNYIPTTEPEPAPESARSTALETVELALWELGHALETAREKIAGIL